MENSDETIYATSAICSSGYGCDHFRKKIIIFDRRIINNDFSALSESSTMWDGGGYGAKHGQHYWILHHRVDKYGYDFIELLFEREIPETEH